MIIFQVTTQDEVDVPGPVSDLRARATSAFSILIRWGHPTYNGGSISKYKLYYRQVSSLSSSLMNHCLNITNIYLHI